MKIGTCWKGWKIFQKITEIKNLVKFRINQLKFKKSCENSPKVAKDWKIEKKKLKNSYLSKITRKITEIGINKLTPNVAKKYQNVIKIVENDRKIVKFWWNPPPRKKLRKY